MKNLAIYIAGGLATLVGIAVIVYTLTKKQPSASQQTTPEKEAPTKTAPSTPKQSGAPTAALVESALPPKQPPSIDEWLAPMKGLTAQQAFTKFKPSDAINDEDRGAIQFGLWLNHFGAWEDVEPAEKENTSIALIMKDSDRERGKRACGRFTVIEIKVQRDGKEAIATGILDTGGDIVRFVAARDTGELVEASRGARFCGFVAGRTSYSNSGGGTTHGAYMVGMFDLPENRALKREGKSTQKKEQGTTIDLTQ